MNKIRNTRELEAEIQRLQQNLEHRKAKLKNELQDLPKVLIRDFVKEKASGIYRFFSAFF